MHERVRVVELLDRLEALLSERWPLCRDRIVTDAAGKSAIPATRLLDGGTARVQLAAFSHADPAGDRQALTSLWGYWYLATTWPPLIISILALGAAPSLRLEQVSLLFDDQARPAGLKVSRHVDDAPAKELLQILVRDQAAPLFTAIAAAGGLPIQVLWSNAAVMLAWTLSQLRELVDDRALGPAHALLTSPYWADGSSNPLAQVARDPSAGGGHSRRICCLGYRLQGLGYCLNCPLMRDIRA